MSTGTGTRAFDQLFETFRNATQTTFQMQRDFAQQWMGAWMGDRNRPGFKAWPGDYPFAAGPGQARTLQRQWSDAILDLMEKHRQSLDQQYAAIIQSTKDAFRVAESEEPEEMRQRLEQFCKNSLDCVRETSEAQIKEFQDAVGKWSTHMARAGEQGQRNESEQ